MEKKIVCSLIEEGMIEGKIADYVQINVEDVDRAKAENLSLSEGKPYVVMIVSGIDSSITTEAMTRLSLPEFRQVTIAKAIVVFSFPQRLASNFYLRFKKPNTPTRIFNDREQAIIWLRKKKDAVLKAVQIN